MSVSLLELCPSSSAPALTLSDRGAARFGVRGAGLDAVVSGDCEFAGAGLEGLEFCAHAATQHASNETKRKLRIDLFYRSPRAARNDCRHRRAVSNSENRLPSCSMR